MNFEELESTWAAQSSASPQGVDAAALKRSVIPELRRRGRFLRYGIFINVLGLVILPLLTVANYRYALPPHPIWYWSRFVLWMLVLAGLLAAFIRATGRHAVLVEQSTRSLRDLAVASLRSIENEMADYRRALWTVSALSLFQLFDLYLKFPIDQFGWRPFGLRAAFSIGLPIVVGLGFWRHYRVNLKPDHAYQKELLQQLS